MLRKLKFPKMKRRPKLYFVPTKFGAYPRSTKSDSIPSFDLAVCDEAHRCAGKRSQTSHNII